MQLNSQWIIQPKPKLSFLSVFKSVGALWTFAPQNSHSTNEHFSFVAQISNNFGYNQSFLSSHYGIHNFK
jgi:hypothetical protein